MEVRSLYREPEQAASEIEFGALEFHDVFKIFRSGPAETVALRGLDLRIEPRELVAVFGPSGSGKSTMLHLAAGARRALGRRGARLRPLAWPARRGRARRLPRPRARDRLPERQPLADADRARERRARAAPRRPPPGHRRAPSTGRSTRSTCAPARSQRAAVALGRRAAARGDRRGCRARGAARARRRADRRARRAQRAARARRAARGCATSSAARSSSSPTPVASPRRPTG